MRRRWVILVSAGLLASFGVGDTVAAPGGGGRGGAGIGRPGGGGFGHEMPGPAWLGGSQRADRQPRENTLPRTQTPPGQQDVRRFQSGSGPQGWQGPTPRTTGPAGSPVYGWNGPANRPFTPNWYANHPKAWQAAHPHADAFVAASATGLAGWLAVPSVWAVGGGTTVYSTQVQASPATGEPTDAVSAESGTPAAASAPVQAGSQPAGDTEWMPLGVFGLMPDGQAQATRLVQLSISREGTVRGSHYDMVSDDVQGVQGAVDKQALRIAFSIGATAKVVFRGPLGELTKPDARVTACFPDGKTASWRMVQVKQVPGL
jgi:hypothetical protein